MQTVRGLQKPLLSHSESAIQAIPAGHAVIQWAAVHASWMYNRYYVHSSLRTTPFQSLFGRSCRRKIVTFGQTVLDCIPKPTNTNMNRISTDGQSVVRTKAIRRIADEWDATLVLGMDVTPSQVFGYRQIRRSKQLFLLVHQVLRTLMKMQKQTRLCVRGLLPFSYDMEIPSDQLLQSMQLAVLSQMNV